MKTTLRTILISTVLATVVSVSAAHAQSSAKEMADNFMATAQAYVQSAVGGSGNVLVTMRGDVAILVGYVENASTKSMAEAAALKDSSVKSVENHVMVSN